ncbi:MAG: isoprenyl transferase [Lachnospiraceae bacterium]|nr:isoprenyl transferase [Lachnospiraceae bacterium]
MQEELKIPRHVAIIMDGNGRWAKAQGKPRTFGHTEGAKRVADVTRAAGEIGIEYVTLYAFSTENWSRTAEEVGALMKLFRSYLKTCTKDADENNMRIRVIGERSALDPDIQEAIREVEEHTASYDRVTLTLAINYGGRDELRRAVRNIAKEVSDGKLTPDDIDQDLISAHLDAPDIPDPDLLIRTCGEQRISNFLLWEIAYSELYFTDVAWPDFGPEELKKAVEAYTHRDRRFGGVKNS